MKKKIKKYEMKCVICNDSFQSHMEHASTCSSRCRQRLYISGFNSNNIKSKVLVVKLDRAKKMLEQFKDDITQTFFIDENNFVHVFVFNPEFLNIRRQYLLNK